MVWQHGHDTKNNEHLCGKHECYEGQCIAGDEASSDKCHDDEDDLGVR